LDKLQEFREDTEEQLKALDAMDTKLKKEVL
jgi:hypothetical protein